MKALRWLLPLLLGALMVAGLILVIDTAAQGPRQPDAWTAGAPMPEAVGFYGYAQCPGDANGYYVISGRISGGYTSGFHYYDAISDTWSSLAPFPAALWAVAATCYDGFIYVAGGGASGVVYDAFYIYDISGDNWSTEPNLPRAVNGATLAAWDGYLYLIGGDEQPAVPITPETQVDRYNIQTGVWEAAWGSPMPVSTLANGIQVGPHVYIIGGYTANYPTNSDTALRYDMDRNQWSIGPAFTDRRAAFGLAVTEQYLYAIGGDADGGEAYDASTDVWRLDHTTWPSGTWEVADSLTQGVLGNSAGTCTEGRAGGEVWSAGGSLGAANVYTDTTWYQPAEPCFRLQPPLVVDLQPAPNSFDAPVTTAVSVDYDQWIRPASVSYRTFAVHAVQSGWHSETISVISGNPTLNPLIPFFPGELVQATATTATLSTGGLAPITPTVWQFITAVDGGSGTFTDSGQRLGLDDNRAMALGDLDGDGDIDAYTADYDGPDQVFLNDGNGVFNVMKQGATTANVLGIALGDLDGDGDLDVFISQWGSMPNNEVWWNDGNGNFTNSGQTLGNGDSNRLALGDLDGDGDLDAFVANDAADKVWLNDGSGHFTDSGQSLGNGLSVSVALGDLDGDGDLDAVVAKGWFSATPNTVWINDGHGFFTDSGQPLGNGESFDVALGDLDSDGDLDAYITNYNRPVGQPDEVWFNDGSGTFTLHQSVGNEVSVMVSLGDLDADGDLDALVGSTTSDLSIWLNDGSGTFVAAQLQPLPIGLFETGDLDNDGDLDVFRIRGALAGQSPNEVWFNEDALDEVVLSGPALGENQVAYTFTATVAPTTTLTPINYTWQADALPPVVHTGGITDAVALAWSLPGTKTITVTAVSPAGVATATHTIRIDDQPIGGLTAANDGPTSLGQPTLLSAGVLSGTNVVYTWTFGDGAIGNGQVVSYTYEMTGTYVVTVTAVNSISSATAVTTVTVELPHYELYLPVAVKP